MSSTDSESSCQESPEEGDLSSTSDMTEQSSSQPVSDVLQQASVRYMPTLFSNVDKPVGHLGSSTSTVVRKHGNPYGSKMLSTCMANRRKERLESCNPYKSITSSTSSFPCNIKQTTRPVRLGLNGQIDEALDLLDELHVANANRPSSVRPAPLSE